MPRTVDIGTEEDTFALRSHLWVLRRRWRVVMVVALVAVTVALVIAVSQPAVYRAEAELLVRESDTATIVSDIPVVNATEAARRLNNEVRLFESGTIRAAVKEAYSGPLDPDDVDASVDSEASDVIIADVEAADPDDAAELVNVYAGTFITVRREQRTAELLAVGEEIQRKLDDVGSRLAEARKPLTDLEGQLADDPENGELAGQVSDVRERLEPTVAPLESQRSFYRSQIEELELSADITRSSGAQVLTNAEPPDDPISPNPPRDAAVALILGLLVGVGVALVIDNLDERVRGTSDLEQVAAGHPTLALIPAIERGRPSSFVSVRDDPKSPQAEAFRTLRTAIKFATLDRPIKVIHVTSPAQGEGKTTAVANLAVALAQGGDRVAVVCCDLRRPCIQERFSVSLTPGLTDVLLGDATLREALRRYDHDVLVLPAGSLPPNPSELLSSNRAAAVLRALSEEFDAVIVDSTPVLPVADALVVSRMADATLVVVDARSTTRKSLRRTLQLLSQVNAPVLGFILNGLPETHESDYGYGYGYRYEPDKDTLGSPRGGRSLLKS